MSEHPLFGLYSLLHIDITIFWQLLRVLYSYSGLAPVRNDLFLCLGFWHAYHYAHIALWQDFRATFLAPAFFALFPSQVLLRRPKLLQSVTFLTWLRLAYPSVRPALTAAVVELRRLLVDWEVKQIRQVRDGKMEGKPENPFRARYVHLLNLQSLFEFAIPIIQDYGLALKGSDWKVFRRCSDRLFLLYCCFTSKGAAEYQAGMYCSLRLLQYWEANQLPIMELLRHNHTLFSEESGEIALGVLTEYQPPNTQANLEVTRQYWQLLRMRYEQLHGDDGGERKRRRRTLSTYFSLFYSLIV